MRLRQMNRLSLISSAIVASLLAGSGCTHPKSAPVAPARTAPSLRTQPVIDATQPTTIPATLPTADTTATTLPTTAPTVADTTTQPATAPVAVTPPAVAPVAAAPTPVTPATAPAPAPTSEPAPVPVTQPTTLPATQPVAQAPLPPVKDEDIPTDAKVLSADAILADRLGNVAELVFANKVTNPDAWPLIWKHQAALMKAAARLVPDESRFLRLEADAYAQLHDPKGELEALSAAIVADQNRLKNADDFVWNRDLDLRLAEYQNAREKIDYLTTIVGSESVPPYVRAHAARLKAQLQLERGEDESAGKTLSEALTKAPLSIECLKLRYSMLPPTATRFERVAQLLELLRANPVQAQYSAELADLVADAGLVNESLPWFNLVIMTLHKEGDPAARSMLHMGVELYLADQLPDAMNLNTALLKIDPTNASAQFLQVILARSLHDKDALNKAMVQASNVFNNRLIDAMNAAGPEGSPKATTRPIDNTDPLALPDLGATIAQINATNKPELKAQFAEALADLAMFEGYFGNQPDAAGKLVDSLKQVLAADDPKLARLTGWNSFIAGKMDDAKTQFTSVAAQDPLAALGLVEVMLQDGIPADREKAESIARRLIVDHPSGLIGAILWERLHNNRIKLIPDEQALALQTPLAAFPRDLFQLVDRPQALYGIRVEPAPMHVGSYVGDPVLGEIRIDNLGTVDLTIGPEGIIKPELIFKLFAPVGQKPPVFDAFDLISGPTVLAQHNRITQIVRLDQTQMLAFLNTQPGVSFPINGTLSTNEVVNRLGGYQVAFTKPFFRQASMMSNFQSISGLAMQGRPDQQITALGQLELFVMQLRSVKEPPEGTPQVIAALLDTIHKVRGDDLPAVAAWACKTEAELSPMNQFESTVRDMVESPDWRHRQLGLLLVGALKPEARDELVKKLLADPQASVREDAVAMQGMLALPAPTSQPTTEPTPATAPPGETATPGLTPILPTTAPTSP